jgi:hypothetical protein
MMFTECFLSLAGRFSPTWPPVHSAGFRVTDYNAVSLRLD